MSIEKSAGAVIFRGNKEREFLLLHYQAGHWDLPKGHLEKGESEIDTAKREVREETGIKSINILEGFKEVIKYYFKWDGENILKFVTFYLAETDEKVVKISEEHIDYKWLPYDSALDRLTFKNAKKILKKAHIFLKNAPGS